MIAALAGAAAIGLVSLPGGASANEVVNTDGQLPVPAVADAFIRPLAPNLNEGANPFVRVRELRSASGVVGFDLSGIDPVSVQAAELVMTIANGPALGSVDVAARPLLEPFTEGDGVNTLVPLDERRRGSGPGTTWRCGTDTDIANLRADCDDPWNGGAAGPVTDTAHVAKRATGEVHWDVTADVQDGITGWLLDAPAHGVNGVDFHSSDSAAASDDPAIAPHLLIVATPQVEIAYLEPPPVEWTAGLTYGYSFTVKNTADVPVSVAVSHDPSSLDFDWNRECEPDVPGCYTAPASTPIDETIELGAKGDPDEDLSYFVVASTDADVGAVIDHLVVAGTAQATSPMSVVAPNVEFAVTKTAPESVSPGDPIEWQVRVDYLGNVAAPASGTLTDAFPEEVIPAGPVEVGGFSTNNCNVVPPPALPPSLSLCNGLAGFVGPVFSTGAGAGWRPGSSQTWQVSAHVQQDAASDTVMNTAVFTFTDENGDEQTTSATAVTDITPSP